MKRKKSKGLIAQWKESFHDKNAVDVEFTVQEPVTEPKASLALIRKVPVTFQLSRFKDPKDFELMSFVIKACAKNADRPYKTVLHVERTRTGSRLVACDGLRLHIAEISKKIKSGDYKPVAAKDLISLGEPVEGIKFPKWPKAIPENAVKRGVINLEKSGIGKDREETEKLSIAFSVFAKQTGETVNLKYLQDLTKREWADYSQNEKQKAVVLKQKSGKAHEPDDKSPVAVILPIMKAA